MPQVQHSPGHQPILQELQRLDEVLQADGLRLNALHELHKALLKGAVLGEMVLLAGVQCGQEVPLLLCKVGPGHPTLQSKGTCGWSNGDVILTLALFHWCAIS